MVKHTVIADVGTALVELLKEKLVPDTIISSGGIGLCSPAEKGDFSLGIFLYNIKECEEYRTSGMQMVSVNQQQFPSAYLTLSYMITAYSSSDLKFRATEEQRILGRTMQVLADINSLSRASIGQDTGGGNMKIELQNLELEDQFKIWSAVSTPYKTSVFYRISPVELESEKTKTIQRVTEMTFKMEEEGE